MNILFATPVQPVANKPRPHHFIKGLVARGHTVHLLTQVSSQQAAFELEDNPSWREVTTACATVSTVVVPKLRSWAQCAASLPSGTPLRVAYCSSPHFIRKAEQLIRVHDCDLAHVHRERIAIALAPLDLPKVLDANDCITLYLRQMVRYGPPVDRVLSGAELMKIPGHEARMANGYSGCLVTSSADAEALRSVGCQANIGVVPNGVADRLLDSEPDSEENCVIFVGTLHYAPNIDALKWFAKQVWPHIRAGEPNAKLRILGYGPTRSVRRLAGISGIEVIGGVPNIMPYLQRATVFVAPLRIGGGFSNKVAEALAAGIPTVATPAALGGIPGLVSGTHLLEARSAEECAEHTISLLHDAPLRGRLSGEGKRLMRAEYRWERACQRLEEFYTEALENR